MSEPLRFERFPDRASWLEARRFSIGSSDAAALMGESNWATPTTLNYSKRGLLPSPAPDIAPDREEELEWHRKRESEIATWWYERQQIKAEALAWKRLGIKAFLWDPGDYTIATRVVNGIPLAATYDRLLLRDSPEARDATLLLSLEPTLLTDDQIAQFPLAWGVVVSAIIAPVELKNASQFMAKYWETEPPIVYSLQLQHQEMVADAKFGYMVASIGGQPPVWAEQYRDGEVCSVLMGAYYKFWDSVLQNYDLPADYKEVTSKAISARFAKDDGSTIKLGDDALLAWKNYRRALDSCKANEELKSEHANNLKRLLGSATFGILPDGTQISWKADKNGNRRQIRLVGEDPEGDESTPKGFPF